MNPVADKLREHCGVVAVYRHGGRAAELVHRGLLALQHRGEEAAGIASWCEKTGSGHIQQLRHRGLVADALPIYRAKKLQGAWAIGHVRYSTVGQDSAANIQPFVTSTPFGPLAIAHNGNLKNTASLAQQLEAAGALLSTTMDTELIVHLLARSGSQTLAQAMTVAARHIQGAYSLAFLCKNRLYGLRDAHGVRPLVLGELPGGFALASETCAIQAMGGRFIREVMPGEWVEIGPQGIKSQQLLEPAKAGPCIFELVYFARPDSDVFGQNVHMARTRMGEKLAEQDLAEIQANKQYTKPDMVVPIPDSGFPAAIGYARKIGVDLEKAIIRSHYIGRTFILPDHDSRTHSLHLKLSVIAKLVEGKRVVLVDDSIVRGNTSRLIVQMVRDAGAREVWLRIASPPLAWPCYLGIDTPNKEELAIHRHSGVDGVQAFIGADNMRYLSLAALQEATLSKTFCTGCMNGNYPI